MISWKFLFCAALVVTALLMTGCASAPEGVATEPGELQACAETKTCILMTPAQMRRFYGLAFQAGRAYEQGMQQGRRQQDFEPPWNDDNFFLRQL
jgi:hypothetical protein